MPYDACVQTFAGLDADIVHWEQQFNCYFEHPAMMENFMRQAMFIPSEPLIVYSGSMTPNWLSHQCVNISSHDIDDNGKHLLSLADSGPEGIRKIVTDVNKKNWMGMNYLTMLHEFAKLYPTAGIQAFDHTHYEKYKCQGPYIPNWGVGCSSWHPSILGHKLRADHYAYIWLSAWKSAVHKILESHLKGEKPEDQFRDADTHLSLFKRPKSLSEHTAVAETKFVSDNIQCYTQFEPHTFRERTLTNIVESGLATDGQNLGKNWQSSVLELILNPNIVEKAKSQGYLDFKNILFANKSAGPITFKITVKSQGTLFICECPSVWGQLPPGFKHLWDSSPGLFLSPISASLSRAGSEVNHQEARFALEWQKRNEDEICIHSKNKVQPGRYILSVVPTIEEYIILSTLLIP